MADAPRLRDTQRALLAALRAGPLSSAGLATACSREVGAVGTSLATLERRNLVVREALRDHSAPNQPRSEWTLTEAGAQALSDAPAPTSSQASAPSAMSLARHQSYVAADVSPTEMPALLDAFLAAEAAASSSFVARLDGRRQQYLFIFDGQVGSGPPEALAAALAAGAIPVDTGTVADVRPIDQFVADARRATRAARPNHQTPTGGRARNRTRRRPGSQESK